jgi:hypothetical protein
LRRLVDIAPPLPGRAIRLSPEAQEHRAKIEQVAEDMKGLPYHPPALRGHLGKWPALYARLLLTLHAIECVSSASSSDTPGLTPEVSGETARKARHLMLKFFLPNTVTFYGEFFQPSPGMDDARWIADHILAHGLESITLRRIRRVYRKLKKDDRAITRAMDILTACGWVDPVEIPRLGTVQWQVSPKVHSKFAERAKEEKARREEERRGIVEREARLRTV